MCSFLRTSKARKHYNNEKIKETFQRRNYTKASISAISSYKAVKIQLNRDISFSTNYRVTLLTYVYYYQINFSLSFIYSRKISVLAKKAYLFLTPQDGAQHVKLRAHGPTRAPIIGALCPTEEFPLAQGGLLSMLGRQSSRDLKAGTKS